MVHTNHSFQVHNKSTQNSNTLDSVPFLYDIRKEGPQSTKITTFTLNYDEALLGPSQELYNTVKNTAPNAIKN